MKLVVPTGYPVPIRRPRGSTVTILNQSATDVYIDTDPNRLAATVAGAVPSGTKIDATTGVIQLIDFPGEYWIRAAAETTVEVTP